MRILKERILSFVLAFVMVVSLFTGMTPTEVQAAVTQEPTEEELNCKLTTVDVTLEVGNEYIQCSELPEPTNSNYKWAYFYYPAPSDMDGYEEGVLGLIASTQESIGVATMSDCKAAHREEYGLLVKDVPSNGQIPVSGDGYGLLYIIQIYDYRIDVDNSGYRYYYNRVAMFDVSKEGTISNGLSGGGETPTPDETDGKIKDLAGIVEHDETTNTFTVTLDPNKRYVISNMPFEYYNNLGMSAATFNENFRDVDDKVATLKTGNSLESFEGVTNIYELDQLLAIVKVYDAINLNTLVTGQSQVTVSLPNGGVFMVHEIKDGDGTERQDSSDGLSGTYYITAGIHGKFVPAVETSGGGGETPAPTEKIRPLADLVNVVNNGSGDYTISFNLDSNKSYVITTATTDNFYDPELFNDTYRSAYDIIINTVGKDVTDIGALTQESVKNYFMNPYESNLIFTNAGKGLVSSYDPITVKDGTYVSVLEVKADEWFNYVDNDDQAPDFSGKCYPVYAAHAVFLPYVSAPAHTHTLTSVPEKPATCKETGYEAHYKCTDENCGKLFADAEGNEPINAPTEIDKAAHTLSAIEKNERGHWGKCSVCDVPMGDDFWEALPHIDTDSNNKCDVCEYEVYHVTLDANGYTDIMVIYVCDAMDNVVVRDIRENVSFIVPKDCTVKVFGTSPIDNAVAPGANSAPASGEGGVNNKTYIFSDFTRNTTIILNHTHGSEGTAWESDAENHWKTCDCTEIIERAAHTDANADNKCDVCEYVLHTHSLTKVPAKEATCTTDGNEEYYKCACGTLFKDAEGKNVTTLAEVKISAIGHDMTKATCTEPATCKRTGCTHTTDELGHDWSGEWTVIKEATATEEGKKETLCTRDCGQKKVIIIPKTGEVDESENLEKDAEVAPDSPIDEVTLNNTKEELLDSDIFTDKEKQDIKDGEDARVWLEVDKLDEDVIPSADKAKVEKEAEKIAGENATITYFDASLFKQIGNGKKTGIEKPGIDMKITIVIPKALLNDDDDMVREYKIIRLHKGEVDIITGEFNEETGEYSFETDRFSTYAIVYGDTPVVPEAPKTADATNLMPILALLFAGLGMVVVGKKKRA